MHRGTAGWLISGVATVTTPALVTAAPPKDLRKIDVCAAVPGAEVARIAGGTLLDAKPFNAADATLARCVYGVAPTGVPAGKRNAWVVEMFTPAAFDELRPHIERPVKDVAGLGDGAYEYEDPDSGRWRIYTRRRGDVTVSVTGTDEPIVRKIAAFVLSRP